MQDKLEIEYFSDVLCVWAYIAQRRLDEVKEKFHDKVQIKYHFLPIFGNTHEKFVKGWEKRGGIQGYAEHVHKVACDFEHVKIHPDVWLKDIPKSSASIHHFLKAVELLNEENKLPQINAEFHRCLYEEIIFQCRERFFKHAINMATWDNQETLLKDYNINVKDIVDLMQSGAAFAELCHEMKMAETYQISGSPTYVLNQGRQKLYGNVGYKVIEANILELLNQPIDAASWC